MQPIPDAILDAMDTVSGLAHAVRHRDAQTVAAAKAAAQPWLDKAAAAMPEVTALTEQHQSRLSKLQAVLEAEESTLANFGSRVSTHARQCSEHVRAALTLMRDAPRWAQWALDEVESIRPDTLWLDSIEDHMKRFVQPILSMARGIRSELGHVEEACRWLTVFAPGVPLGLAVSTATPSAEPPQRFGRMAADPVALLHGEE